MPTLDPFVNDTDPGRQRVLASFIISAIIVSEIECGSCGRGESLDTPQAGNKRPSGHTVSESFFQRPHAVAGDRSLMCAMQAPASQSPFAVTSSKRSDVGASAEAFAASRALDGSMPAAVVPRSTGGGCPQVIPTPMCGPLAKRRAIK